MKHVYMKLHFSRFQSFLTLTYEINEDITIIDLTVTSNEGNEGENNLMLIL